MESENECNVPPRSKSPAVPGYNQQQVLGEIKNLIEQVDSGSTFALGGEIPVLGPVNANDPEAAYKKIGNALYSSPIQIRFDGPDDSGCKLTLPLNDDDKPTLERLVEACAPASMKPIARQASSTLLPS
jgi:hypothetical protein